LVCTLLAKQFGSTFSCELPNNPITAQEQYLMTSLSNSHHTLVAAISAKPPSPTFDIDFGNIPATDPRIEASQESPLYCPSGTFDQVYQSKRCSQATLQILYNAKDLVDLLVNDYENEERAMGVLMAKAQLESHLSANDPQSTSHGDWIFESCRITALIILQAIETATPLASSNPSLTLSLAQALGKSNIGDNWGDMLGVLYWVSIIGLAAAQESAGHRLLGSALSRVMFEMAFTVPNLECALRPIQRFACMQAALKRELSFTPIGFEQW
jgi:hypothetical protein